MLITLEPGANRNKVVETLNEVAAEAGDLLSTDGAGREMRLAYLKWVNKTRAKLRGQISNADLDRLVTTPRYITVLSMQITEAPIAVRKNPNPRTGPAWLPVSGPDTLPIRNMIELEVAEHIRSLEAASATLRKWSDLLDSLDRPGHFVIADSSVYCHHPSRLNAWEVSADINVLPSHDVHLILPLAVLDELDRQKDRGQGGASTNARETIKQLDSLLPNGVVRRRGTAPENPAFPRGAITMDLWPDPAGHIRMVRTDDEIIARAVAFQALAGRSVHLLTGDIGMCTRARMAGLDSTRLDMPNATHKPPKAPRGDKHPALTGSN
ncbi:hypothetical protein Psi02_72440 [Planotetraspora silvatica]|uniref:PIN domain-containing protein n=1 Tax=Planotetraspora silvatica TaxID=234614 RepID=A0A8J3V6C7_9ACTN|nr:PIN domain-containing protein [Planotetraspora silvatica]GII50820.1 hypothetical protein Psi02_72440 [Planotetraspora silvatica]